MITNKVVKELYKTYRNRVKSVDELNLQLLSGEVADVHQLEIKDGRLFIGSLGASPFSALSLSRIHAIENFENDIAIVLHSSILFLDKKTPAVKVNVKMKRPSFWQMLRFLFCRK